MLTSKEIIDDTNMKWEFDQEFRIDYRFLTVVDRNIIQNIRIRRIKRKAYYSYDENVSTPGKRDILKQISILKDILK